MAKKFNYTYVLLGVGALVLLYTLKNKSIAGIGLVYKAQKDPPSGTYQVYSKLGTKLYDRNGQLIYTFQESNQGMTVLGTEINGTLNVVFGEDFDNGLPAFALPNEVQYL